MLPQQNRFRSLSGHSSDKLLKTTTACSSNNYHRRLTFLPRPVTRAPLLPLAMQPGLCCQLPAAASMPCRLYLHTCRLPRKAGANVKVMYSWATEGASAAEELSSEEIQINKAYGLINCLTDSDLESLYQEHSIQYNPFVQSRPGQFPVFVRLWADPNEPFCDWIIPMWYDAIERRGYPAVYEEFAYFQEQYHKRDAPFWRRFNQMKAERGWIRYQYWLTTAEGQTALHKQDVPFPSWFKPPHSKQASNSKGSSSSSSGGSRSSSGEGMSFADWLKLVFTTDMDDLPHTTTLWDVLQSMAGSCADPSHSQDSNNAGSGHCNMSRDAATQTATAWNGTSPAADTAAPAIGTPGAKDTAAPATSASAKKDMFAPANTASAAKDTVSPSGGASIDRSVMHSEQVAPGPAKVETHLTPDKSAATTTPATIGNTTETRASSNRRSVDKVDERGLTYVERHRKSASEQVPRSGKMHRESASGGADGAESPEQQQYNVYISVNARAHELAAALRWMGAQEQTFGVEDAAHHLQRAAAIGMGQLASQLPTSDRPGKSVSQQTHKLSTLHHAVSKMINNDFDAASRMHVMRLLVPVFLPVPDREQAEGAYTKLAQEMDGLGAQLYETLILKTSTLAHGLYEAMDIAQYVREETDSLASLMDFLCHTHSLMIRAGCVKEARPMLKVLDCVSRLMEQPTRESANKLIEGPLRMRCLAPVERR